MNWKFKIGLGVLIILLVGGLARYCDRPVESLTDTGKLAPGERERIEVKGRSVTVIRKDKTTRTYAPGGAKVSIGKDGEVSVSVKKLGLCLEPGLGAAWNGDRLKLELDGKVFYYRRLGLHAGLAVDPQAKLKDIVHPLAFLSYTMPSDTFANTSLWLGGEFLPVRLSGGIRLAF